MRKFVWHTAGISVEGYQFYHHQQMIKRDPDIYNSTTFKAHPLSKNYQVKENVLARVHNQ
jgi:hypothetical protein